MNSANTFSVIIKVIIFFKPEENDDSGNGKLDYDEFDKLWNTKLSNNNVLFMWLNLNSIE